MECFLFVMVGWIFSVTLHEYGHAIVAYRAGDFTVKEKGYLSFNPLLYAHPVYSFVMPIIFVLLGGIGLPGGAVYIQDDLIRSRNMRSLVSLAGPAMNVALVIILCVPFWLNLVPPASASVVGPTLAFLIHLEISAIIFNLLPIPSLDGFGALAPFMKYETAHWFRRNSNYFILALFIIMFNSDQASDLFWSAVIQVSVFLGLDPHLIGQGWRLFRFWET